MEWLKKWEQFLDLEKNMKTMKLAEKTENFDRIRTLWLNVEMMWESVKVV